MAGFISSRFPAVDAGDSCNPRFQDRCASGIHPVSRHPPGRSGNGRSWRAPSSPTDASPLRWRRWGRCWRSAGNRCRGTVFEWDPIGCRCRPPGRRPGIRRIVVEYRAAQTDQIIPCQCAAIDRFHFHQIALVGAAKEAVVNPFGDFARVAGLGKTDHRRFHGACPPFYDATGAPVC